MAIKRLIFQTILNKENVRKIFAFADSTTGFIQPLCFSVLNITCESSVCTLHKRDYQNLMSNIYLVIIQNT